MAFGCFRPFPKTRFAPETPETGPNRVFAQETQQLYGKRVIWVHSARPAQRSLCVRYQSETAILGLVICVTLLILIGFILKAAPIGACMPCAPCALADWPVSPWAAPLCCPLSTANNLFPQVENLSHRTDCCSGSNELFQQNSAKTFIAQKSRNNVESTIIDAGSTTTHSNAMSGLDGRTDPRATCGAKENHISQ